MKKLLASVILAFTLVFGAMAQDSPLKQLGQGYEAKDRQVEGQTVKLVHFPLRCWATGPSRYAAYRKCVEVAIGKVFKGRASKPVRHEDQIYTVVGKRVYRIGPLGDYVGGEITLVGVTLVEIGVQKDQKERYF